MSAADQPGAPPDVAIDAPRVDGRSQRWREHRARRRNEFIDAAFRAIAEHGPETRMTQIAAAAGTTKPKLYRYFAAKSHLVRAITERSLQMIAAPLAGRLDATASIRSGISTWLDGYMQFVEENPSLISFLRDNDTERQGSRVLLTRARAVARTLVELADDDTADHVPDNEIEQLAHAVVGAVLGATDGWSLQDRSARISRARAVTQLSAVLTSAIEGALGDWELDLDLDNPGQFAAVGEIMNVRCGI